MSLKHSYLEDFANMRNLKRDKDKTKQLLQWQFGSNIGLASGSQKNNLRLNQKIQHAAFMHTCMLLYATQNINVTSSSLYRPGVFTLVAELIYFDQSRL